MKYKTKDLVKVAKRENNNLREYIYVNPIQGKHVPTDPLALDQLITEMAKTAHKTWQGEKILVIGFAETATALGLGVAAKLKEAKYCMHTTRTHLDEADIVFSESHSHATEQYIHTKGLQAALKCVTTVLFVEDEVTTGNTISKAITQLKEFNSQTSKKDNLKFGVLSVLNTMPKSSIQKWEAQGIKCRYIKHLKVGELELGNHRYNEESSKKAKEIHTIITPKAGKTVATEKFCDTAYVTSVKDLLNFNSIVFDICAKYVAEKGRDLSWLSGKDILVLGTDEFMYIPYLFALSLAMLGKYQRLGSVSFHATTRSPILTSEDNNYPLNSRHRIEIKYDCDKDATMYRYIYNLKKYDKVYILTDNQIYAPNGTNRTLHLTNSLIKALVEQGIDESDINILKLKTEVEDKVNG